MKKILGVLILSIFTLSLSGVAEADCNKCGRSSKAKQSWSKCDGNALSQLSEAKEMAYHKAMRKLRAENMPIRKKMGGIKGEMAAVFTAKKFDQKKFDALKTKWIELKVKKMHNMRRSIGKLAKGFNAKERGLLMKALKMKRGCSDKQSCSKYWGKKNR